MVEVVAETERLRLRAWRDGDRREFVRHLNTPAVMRWLGEVQDEALGTAAIGEVAGGVRGAVDRVERAEDLVRGAAQQEVPWIGLGFGV